MNNILIVTLGNGGYLHMSKLLGTYRKVKVHIYRLYPMKGGDVNRSNTLGIPIFHELLYFFFTYASWEKSMVACEQ